MDKSKLNYWIDIGLIISFIGVFITGVFKFWYFRKIFAFMFDIISKENMRTIHDFSGIAMGLLVIIHLILNWKWLSCETKELFTKKNGK